MFHSFFDYGHTARFQMFSMVHWFVVSIFITLLVLLFVSKRFIKRSPRVKAVIRWSIVIILIMSEVTLNLWYLGQGIWNMKNSLPLELCSISLLLAIAMLLTRNRLLYQIVFFAGIAGAVQALLTPSLDYSYPHFRFIQFFVAHIAIIVAALYMTWIENYKPTWKSIGITMIALNILALLVGVINYFTGSNYMFLMHKPSSSSILDLLGPHPYYLIAEELIALLTFVILHLAFFVIPDLFKKESSTTTVGNHELRG
ncbi:putative integral membrane protein (TIGR02206 family) [Paenibacillus sp. DS2015]|uniref:YwaF family protein n=1 Tax=Paenibacillus sp. DS2015 TaxID=3373917 RepID=UPI003D21CAB1